MGKAVLNFDTFRTKRFVFCLLFVSEFFELWLFVWKPQVAVRIRQAYKTQVSLKFNGASDMKLIGLGLFMPSGGPIVTQINDKAQSTSDG